MANNYNDLFKHYIALTQELPLIEALNRSTLFAEEVFKKLIEEKATFSYQQGKWTIAQLLSHIVDVERVFAYRAMRYSRMDKTQVASFDDDHYAIHSGAEKRSIDSLLKEFYAQRASTNLLFKSFTTDMLSFSDQETDKGLTVENICRMIAGHSMHHCNVLLERYGV